MTGLAQGRGLTLVALLLAAAALAAAGRVAAVGRFEPGDRGEASCSVADAARAQSLLADARRAEARGDIPAALAGYRAAVGADGRLADRNDPRFLGPGFEGRLKGWIAGFKAGTLPGASSAMPDASYLFRRMYGGCG
jgi:hypothetical protein